MQINEILVSEIKPYEKNNKKHPRQQVEDIAVSIKQFGFKQPLVIDKDKVIIIGHGRFEAAKMLGLKTVPCVIADDLNEEQIKKLRIVDNKTNESEWDIDNLLAEIRELEFNEFNFSFDELEDKETKEIEEDNFDIDSNIPEEPKSKLGDVFELGRHRLMCGDSTIREDVEKLMNGQIADLVVTDPPYNVDYGSKAEAINSYGYHFSDRHIKNDYMPQEEFINFLDKAFSNMSDSLKAGGVFYIWHASVSVFEFETALRLNNLKSRQQLIWVKNAMVLGRQDYQWIHEPCLYGWKEGAGHYFVNDRTKTTVIEDEALKNINKLKKEQLVAMLKELTNPDKPVSIIREDRPSRSPDHPMQKPLKLLAHSIRNSSKPGELVLDLFGGSSSTLMTCEQLDRTCYTMEFDPKFIDVTIKRFIKLTGQKVYRLNANGTKTDWEEIA